MNFRRNSNILAYAWVLGSVSLFAGSARANDTVIHSEAVNSSESSSIHGEFAPEHLSSGDALVYQVSNDSDYAISITITAVDADDSGLATQSIELAPGAEREVTLEIWDLDPEQTSAALRGEIRVFSADPQADLSVRVTQQVRTFLDIEAQSEAQILDCAAGECTIRGESQRALAAQFYQALSEAWLEDEDLQREPGDRRRTIEDGPSVIRDRPRFSPLRRSGGKKPIQRIEAEGASSDGGKKKPQDRLPIDPDGPKTNAGGPSMPSPGHGPGGPHRGGG